MMHWRFETDDVWSFDDLSPEERAFAEEQGCEAGKKYFGEPDADHEVAQCPFCKQVVWDESHCQHVVFQYVHGSQEYLYINSRFEQHFWNHLVPALEGDQSGYILAVVRAGAVLADVPPREILEIVDDMQTSVIDSVSDDTGEVCGFMPPEMLAQLPKER